LKDRLFELPVWVVSALMICCLVELGKVDVLDSQLRDTVQEEMKL
jgi:hypothetical protein